MGKGRRMRQLRKALGREYKKPLEFTVDPEAQPKWMTATAEEVIADIRKYQRMLRGQK